MMDEKKNSSPQDEQVRGLPFEFILAAVVLLICLVAAVFYPVVGFEFVDWDTLTQVVDNPYIRGLTYDNFVHILTTPCINSYYPVRTMTFALNYEIGGMRPWIFKLTNVLIHLGCVLQAFWLVRRLYRHPDVHPATRGPAWDLWAATFGAGLYAMHPVVVEPVAWIAGREELLMTFFALACLHMHLTARQCAGKAGKRWVAVVWHLGAAVCCLAASMCNAVGAIIPVLIVAADIFLLPRPKFWRIVIGTAPLWAISVITIIAKQGTEGDIPIPPPVFSLGRVKLVMDIYALNMATLFRPTKLSLFYDWEYPHAFTQPAVALGGLAILATLLLMWWSRRNRMLLFGLFFFCLAMGPVSQVMPHHIQRADRYFYLPFVGLTIAAAMAVREIGGRLKARLAVMGVVLATCLLLVLLAVKSTGQVATWRNSLSAWENCLWVNPDNARAHDALADNLVKIGRLDLAITHFETVLRLLPNNIESMSTLAKQLACGDERLRDYPRAIELGTRACELTEWGSFDVRRDLAEIYTCLAVSLQERGEFGQAILYYRQATEVDPDYPEPLLNLALMYATCPDERQRRPQEAVQLAERGVSKAYGLETNSMLILSIAYAQVGQLELAALTIERAMLVAQRMRDMEAFNRLQRQLDFYRQAIEAGGLPGPIVINPSAAGAGSPGQEGRPSPLPAQPPPPQFPPIQMPPPTGGAPR